MDSPLVKQSTLDDSLLHVGLIFKECFLVLSVERSFEMFRLLITGSRSWVDTQAIRDEFDIVQAHEGSNVVLVSGNCPRGADKQCEDIALEYGWSVELHPLAWKGQDGLGEYNPRAGFERNKLMVDLGADFVLAFVMNQSGGAMNTVGHSRSAGIPTKIINRTTPIVKDWLMPYTNQKVKA
jgi:hypothetical protein